MPAPGESIHRQFTLRNLTTQAIANAASTPTAILVRNGSDTSVVCTVENLATGVYRVTASIPSTYITGDELQFRVTATVAGVTGTRDFDQGEVEARAAAAPTATTGDWLTNATNARDNYSQLLVELSSSPAMTYSVNGQSFSKTEYQRYLIDAIKALDDLIGGYDGPFEELSVGYT